MIRVPDKSVQQNRAKVWSYTCPFYFYVLIYFIEVYLIYNIVLVSDIQQSDSVIHIYILFQILFDYGLLQDIEYSSLCCTVGPYSLSILYIIVWIC